MAAHEGFVLCSLLLIFSPAEGKEVTITCVNSEDCVLPCRFQSDGQGARIMWYKRNTVVSCTRYGNTSFVVGHNSPADEYKGRTRLYADQVLKGNATLILKNIRPEDQGRYICLTMTALQTESAAINVNIRDAVVSCVFMESCILPCSFQGGTDVIVHWFQEEPQKTPVHSYYHNQDQLVAQNLRFRGRTSLFQDQISGGNASLQLTGVKVQDEGRYQCYTSTETGVKSHTYLLKVNALIRKVDIQQEGNRITCSSEGIYPEPELTWSTNPPSNVTFKNSTTVQQTEQQLYNINSSLIVSDGVTGLDYSCTVSTDRSRRTATLFKPISIDGSDTETTIPCTSTNSPIKGFSLIWRFDHSQIILNQTSVSYTVSDEWKQHVKSVSESGSLTLHDLSSNQEGTYACELSKDEETNVTNISLRIKKSPDSHSSRWEVFAKVTALILIAALAVAACVAMLQVCPPQRNQLILGDCVNEETPSVKTLTETESLQD